MSQLYKIGIIIAVMLFVLLGLSKIAERSAVTGDESTETPSAESQENETPLEDNEPATMNTFEDNTTVVMKTNKGDITIELFTKDMPITAGNFLKLAQEDFYDGVKFHRVIDGFMIQGGDPESKDDSKQALWGRGGPGYTIQDEFVEGYSNVRGTIAMANSGPESGGSQFFINLVDNVNLDFDKVPETSKHPVFARVVDGMDVVDAIGKVETDMRDVPVEPVVIEDIVVQ